MTDDIPPVKTIQDELRELKYKLGTVPRFSEVDLNAIVDGFDTWLEFSTRPIDGREVVDELRKAVAELVLFGQLQHPSRFHLAYRDALMGDDMAEVTRVAEASLAESTAKYMSKIRTK